MYEFLLWASVSKANVYSFFNNTTQDKELNTMVDEYVEIINELKNKNHTLELENNTLKTLVNQLRNNKAILVPDAKYLGNGNYCYPLFVETNKYKWVCNDK